MRALIVVAVHLFPHGSGLAYEKDAEDSGEEQRQVDLTGVIAHATDSEIRAVNADGTEDRSVWALPTAEDYAVHSLAWN